MRGSWLLVLVVCTFGLRVLEAMPIDVAWRGLFIFGALLVGLTAWQFRKMRRLRDEPPSIEAWEDCPAERENQGLIWSCGERKGHKPPHRAHPTVAWTDEPG